MTTCKGIVTDVRQHGGCVEVIVPGPRPGAFTIDNCLMWGIVDAEGRDWIDRAVEYADGAMRFLDTLHRGDEQPITDPDGDLPDPLPATAG